MKISFSNLGKAPVVLFDSMSAELLRNSVLAGIPYVSVEARGQSLTLHWRVILHFLAGIFQMQVGHIFAASSFREAMCWFREQLIVNYYRAVVASCAPKVVVTFTDNSFVFQRISRSLSGPRFYAIQNGVRCPEDVYGWLPKAPHPAHHISMPYYFSMGRYEQDLYASYGHRVDRFDAVGSLNFSVFLRENPGAPNESLAYDLCLVSQWSTTIGKIETLAMLLLCQATRTLLIRHPHLRLVIASRSNGQEERDYFNQHFGSLATYSEFQPRRSTYLNMLRSCAVLTVDSTAGREILGFGRKVLFCNFTGHPSYSSPKAGIWSLTDSSQFEQRVLEVLSMKHEDWQSEVSEYANYLMQDCRNVNAEQTIRRRVLQSIENT